MIVTRLAGKSNQLTFCARFSKLPTELEQKPLHARNAAQRSASRLNSVFQTLLCLVPQHESFWNFSVVFIRHKSSIIIKLIELANQWRLHICSVLGVPSQMSLSGKQNSCLLLFELNLINWKQINELQANLAWTAADRAGWQLYPQHSHLVANEMM